MAKLKVEITIEFDTEEELRLVMDEIFNAAERCAKNAKRASQMISGAKGVRAALRKQRTADLLEVIGDALDTASIKRGTGVDGIVLPGVEIKIGDMLLAWSLRGDVDGWHDIEPAEVRSITGGDGGRIANNEYSLDRFYFRVVRKKEG